MMRICMCHDVWKCNVFSWGKQIPDCCWRKELNSSFPLGITNKDDWENNPAGENNSVVEWTDKEMTLGGVYTLLEDLLIWRNKTQLGMNNCC